LKQETLILFRPVGQTELDLIARSGFRCFPPRLPDQPIFYPVLSVEYARQIARDWNTKDEFSGFVGYVTRFAVFRPYVDQFQVQRVGDRSHLELWVPAEKLDEFNSQIDGLIEVVEEYRIQTS
jgi:hypothetical protein